MPIFQGILGAAGSAFGAMEEDGGNLFNDNQSVDMPFNDVQFDVYTG